MSVDDGAGRRHGPVDCDCGETIADRVTADTVTVNGDTYRFRRATDYLLCTGCGRAFPADELRERAGLG